MKKRRILTFICCLVVTLILTAGFRTFNLPPVVAQANTNLLISAAASLKDSLEQIKPLYQKAKTNIRVSYNFGASGALQQQIENGAPADIFISAAAKQMDALQQKGLILPDTRRNLLRNRLVLVVPKNFSGISNFRQLTSTNIKRIAVGEPRSVPAGQYAEEVFKNLGIFNQIRPKLVFGNNVRQVLAFVESGNAEAGLVYATDAKISTQVKVVATAPDKSHSPIVYPVAVLKSSKNVPAAKEYIQFLFSSPAKSIFQKDGFKM